MARRGTVLPAIRWSCMAVSWKCDRLQRSQERDEVALLFGREADREACVVELDDRREIGRGAIVEVRRSRRKRTQDRPLELADVDPFAGDERAARIGDRNGRARRLAVS